MLRTEFVDAERWASRAADVFATSITNAVAARGHAVVALSGSVTPLPVLAELATRQLPWINIVFTQVDERIAPLGSPERNLTAQQELLGSQRCSWLPLPVDKADEAGIVGQMALDEFEVELKARLGDGQFDIVHLGLGSDGHTASLVPGDPLLGQAGGFVGQSIEYNGARRLTLTSAAINNSRRVIWLIRGDAKTRVLERLLAHDATIPAALISQDRAIVIADEAANPSLRRV